MMKALAEWISEWIGKKLVRTERGSVGDRRKRQTLNSLGVVVLTALVTVVIIYAGAGVKKEWGEWQETKKAVKELPSLHAELQDFKEEQGRLNYRVDLKIDALLLSRQIDPEMVAEVADREWRKDRGMGRGMVNGAGSGLPGPVAPPAPIPRTTPPAISRDAQPAAVLTRPDHLPTPAAANGSPAPASAPGPASVLLRGLVDGAEAAGPGR